MKTPQWVEQFKPTGQIPLSQYTNRKNAPLDFIEIAYREVKKDEASERSFTPPKPRYEPSSPSQSTLKSVGWLNFFKSSVESFVMQFKP